MGICKYCGNKAGLFRKKHKECHSLYLLGTYKIPETSCMAILEQWDFKKLDSEVKEIALRHFINDTNSINKYIIRGFNRAVDSYLEDGILSEEEEDNISRFLEYYNFEQDQLNEFQTMEKVVKGSILRDVMAGKIPESRVKLTTPLPIVLQNSEYVVWLFKYVDFYEQRTRTTYVGSSQGLSVRVAKGLYYRTGSFKGHPVKTEEMTHISNGSVVITNKHFFFISSNKNLKIPFNKLITIEPYEDGIGIQKDGVSSKPQTYKGLDGWFIYNYITNVVNLR